MRWWHAFLPLTTSHFLSVLRISDLGNYLLLLCKPWLSFLLFSWSLCAKLLVCFSQLTSPSLTNAHSAVTVQIPAAFTGTSHSPVQLVSAGLGFSEGSCSRAGYRPIETCLVAQPCLPQGGGEEEKLSVEIYWLWRPHDFLLNMKIPSIIRIIVSKPPVRPFIIYLNITGSEVFFLSVTSVHHLP